LELARPAPAPTLIFGDCRAFTAPAMDAGAPRQAAGIACLQADGRWLITSESPAPAAAIAWGTPPTDASEHDAAVYYPFDPRDHQAGLFDGGWGSVPGGHRHGDRSRSFGGFGYGGFGSWRN
jgi:hypothetical protein